MQPLIGLQQAIPSNKFYPPRLDAANNLFRDQLIRDIIEQQGHHKKILFIEAQAGQGKSTLVAQFLRHADLPFAWYQLGPEDSDPVLLLTALIADISWQLPGFKSPQLMKIIRQGEIGPLDIQSCVNILLADLDRHLAGEFYLVFDDLHLVENAPLSSSLLDHLIDTSPPHLHFILMSRRPPVLSSKILRYGTDVFYLRNEDLSLSPAEVEQLITNVLKKEISRQEALRIHDFTGGWIMGILLAAHPRHGLSCIRNRNDKPKNPSADMTSEQMIHYFRDEILANIPEDIHLPLLKLSFLEEIPVVLAARITDSRDIGDILIRMMRDNFFVLPLDDNRQVFRLHHLFQEFLQHQARKILEQEEINKTYHEAATFYLAQNQVEKALSCYLRAGDYQAMEEIIKLEGLHLLARNRTVTLLTLIKSIPEKHLFEYGWLTLLGSLVFADFHPRKILPLLEAARDRFTSQEDEIGELLTLSHLLYYHFVVSGLYRTGSELLERTARLFIRHQDHLPVHARIMVARNIAAGYSFFNSETEKAREYAVMARNLAIRNDIRNCIVSTRFVCGYTESLTGNMNQQLREIELTFPLLYDPLVGRSNKLTLLVLQLNFLTKYGHFVSFGNLQQRIRKDVDAGIVEQTVTGPYFYVWGAANFIAQGKNDRALELLLSGFDSSNAAQIPHMRSQFLQWLAYLHALLGNRTEACKCARESMELRRTAGGPFYEALNDIVLGAAYTRLEMFDEAKKLLEKGRRLAATIPSPYLRAVSLMHHAWIYLQEEQKGKAATLLHEALNLMHRHGYTCFWTWEPRGMKELLQFAVRHDLAAEFAALLARERLDIAFDSRGNVIPLLHFSILTALTIRQQGRELYTAQSFTPAQRTLLGMLLASPHRQLSQEHIQLALWPDSPPDKARSKFDTLLMRLRRALGSRLTVPVKHYLSMQKGILSLENCRVDAEEFMQQATSGLSLVSTENWWQAGNAFEQALGHWPATTTDCFAATMPRNYQDGLINLLTRMGRTWATSLDTMHRSQDAISVLTRILAHNPMDDRLIALLYGLYIRNNEMLKAKELLIDYRQTLRDFGYDQEQIDDLLFGVVSRG
ncbi:P-loop domain-containing protein [Desulfolithobacter sp.]